MEKPYKNLDHTGDLEIEAYGGSPEELMQNTSLALIDTITEVKTILPARQVEWVVEGGNFEDMLVGQLQEILYRLDSEGMVFSRFQISFPVPRILKCLAYGEALDREKHGFKTEIKAITYHRLFVGQEGGRWVARVIFDV
jgi:SHS2 domain-containing protein